MQNSGASFISCLQMKTDLPIPKKLRSSHIKYCMLESPRDYRIYRGTEEQCILVLFSYFSPLCLACLSCKFGRKRWSSLVVRKQCQQPRWVHLSYLAGCRACVFELNVKFQSRCKNPRFISMAVARNAQRKRVTNSGNSVWSNKNSF